MEMKRAYFVAIIFLLGCKGSPPAEAPIEISGIYPHLAMYNERPRDAGVGETGVGAVVPWSGRLWVMTYAASHPYGGADKLYEIDSNLNVTIRPESIGGTHANRMIHRESEQLIIGPYFVDKDRNVRAIPSSKMSGRLTGVARHLTDPANKVYFFAMEEGFYEVDVNTLDVKTLYEDGFIVTPRRQVIDREHVFGTHAKGAYSSQGRVVISNNGIRDWTTASTEEGTGALGEWDGEKWRDVSREQYVEVTGPGGIYGNERESDPIWATGWDQRSVILKVLEDGKWYDYRMPKASFTYDGLHGHFTEWPRIRDIDNGRKLMTMHGMFWEFPRDFSIRKSAGIRPLSSYLKIIPDFSMWQDRLVIGCDDASTFENPLVGRPQSNLWFIKPEQLKTFGPRSGFGGVWIDDKVAKNEVSVPFLLEGFDHKVVHLAHNDNTPLTFTLEVDENGTGDWKRYDDILVPAKGYAYRILPADFSATWVRVKANSASNAVTAYFTLSQKDTRKAAEKPPIFSTLAEAGAEHVTYGLVRAGSSDDISLQFQAYERDNGGLRPLGYYEVGGDMKMRPIPNDTIGQWLENKIGFKDSNFKVDESSVIVYDGNGRAFRLPKGDKQFDNELLRGIREVVTERSLFNCHGTIYELPRESAGGVAGIKPISTHNRLIYDFCSWRGMMVISGNVAGASNNGNYFSSEDGKTGLWFGTIDDLWKFGKPVGTGGPWLRSKVEANQYSDPYLMTGYDQKEMRLSHDSNNPVEFTVEVDLTTYGNWKTFERFTVKPGETLVYQFPDGYLAHWVRLKTNAAATVSAQFEYK